MGTVRGMDTYPNKIAPFLDALGEAKRSAPAGWNFGTIRFTRGIQGAVRFDVDTPVFNPRGTDRYDHIWCAAPGLNAKNLSWMASTCRALTKAAKAVAKLDPSIGCPAVEITAGDSTHKFESYMGREYMVVLTDECSGY